MIEYSETHTKNGDVDPMRLFSSYPKLMEVTQAFIDALNGSGNPLAE